jgi:hypothetical protein
MEFIRKSTAFAIEKERCAAELIDDLSPGRRQHHDIHCVGFSESFNVLIGMSKEEFSNLLESLRSCLETAFPNCPFVLLPHEKHPYSSIRMKVFMFLFRIKNACSFAFMEGIFGWSTSALDYQFHLILHIVHRRLKCLHTDGILEYLGQEYLQSECECWKLNQLASNSFIFFNRRIEELNQHAVTTKEPRLIAESFLGSVGAVDCTYSICPRIGERVLAAHGEDPTSDRMYSEYVKNHGYKLHVLTTHGIRLNSPKLVLDVRIRTGNSSDASMFGIMLGYIEQFLPAGAVFQADNAYHKCRRCIIPYNATEQVQYGNDHECHEFNNVHSKGRVASEHGIRFLKSWGVVRGRDDHIVFELTDNFIKAVHVAQALHNYLALNCPQI